MRKAPNLTTMRTITLRFPCLSHQGSSCLRQSVRIPPQLLPSFPMSLLTWQCPGSGLAARCKLVSRRCDLHLLAQVHRTPTDVFREPWSSSVKAFRHRVKLHKGASQYSPSVTNLWFTSTT